MRKNLAVKIFTESELIRLPGEQPAKEVVLLLHTMKPYSVMRLTTNSKSKPAVAASSIRRAAKDAGYAVRVATHGDVITIIYEGKIR